MTAHPSPSAAADPGAPPGMVRLHGLSMRFGERQALDGLSMAVAPGELFALLGPNGSGKSTLLRILATLLRPTAGTAEVDGLALLENPGAVRRRLGVVFQHPSLDDKLSVLENLRFQGYLYGLSGRALAARVETVLERFALGDRRAERVQALSGGLKRRVELAKALLHRPAVLLLDEPSTGLDLAARQAFWQTLAALRAEDGLTILLTTHLMDEAEGCDRVGLLDEGRLVALERPETLKRELGEAVVTIETGDAPGLARRIRSEHGLEARVVANHGAGGRVRLAGPEAVALAPRLLNEGGAEVSAVRLGRPTLGDVFLARTGHAFNAPDDAAEGDPA